MAEHSPEPWSTQLIRGEDDMARSVVVCGLFDANGKRVADFLCDPDLNRIVACVNACKGIPIETLEAVARGETLILRKRDKLYPPGQP